MGCTVSSGISLSAQQIHVYGLIASGEWKGEPNSEHPDIQKLVELGFVAFHELNPDTPVALDPNEAARRRVEQELKEAQARVARMRELPQLADELAPLYQQGQWTAGGTSEYIDDVAVVNARLDDIIASARTEILSAQPLGPRTQEQLNRSLARDQAALARGVELRTLYRDTVRDNPVTAQYARTMSARGAHYSTLVGPFERCIIVDRRVAFISNHLVEQAPEHSAWQITCRATVAYIVAEFEAKLRRANPWAGELRGRGATGVDTVSSPDGVRTTRLQREILRDLAAGHAQSVIARRVGVSKRKLEEEIAGLKVLLGAQTPPELTYKWALLPDRLIDDSAPTDAVGATGTEPEA
jgi:hypothetical protein